MEEIRIKHIEDNKSTIPRDYDVAIVDGSLSNAEELALDVYATGRYVIIKCDSLSSMLKHKIWLLSSSSIKSYPSAKKFIKIQYKDDSVLDKLLEEEIYHDSNLVAVSQEITKVFLKD